MPKLSVVIPVYGVERYIERCAVSLFEQSLTEIEFIFVDDCSPDRSVEILRSVVERYGDSLKEMNDSVKIVRTPSNGGQCAARRFGMQLAAGDFVINCDSDDWLEKDAYTLMYRKAVDEGADLVVCDLVSDDAKGTQRYYKSIGRGLEADTIIVDAARDKATWSLCDKIIRRSLLESVVAWPQYNMGEDMVITFQILATHPKVAYVQKALYHYFINTDSITKHVTKQIAFSNFAQLKGNVDTLKSALLQKGEYERYKEVLDCLYYRTLNILVKFIPDSEVYALWRQTVKDLGIDVLHNPYIKSHYKTRHIILMAHLNFLFIRKKNK